MKKTIGCLLFILGFGIAQGLKCYNCEDCKSHVGYEAVECSGTATQCIKTLSVFDKVSRQCGTEDTCQQKKMKTEAYKSAHCCNEDKCNSSERAAPFWMFVSMATVLLKVIL